MNYKKRLKYERTTILFITKKRWPSGPPIDMVHYRYLLLIKEENKRKFYLIDDCFQL